MADLQKLKKLGIDGNGEKTRELIKKLNSKDETIFNELQDITKATAGMSQADIVKATGIPFKEWQSIVAKFDKDRVRIVNSPNFSKDSFTGRYYPGRSREIKVQRDLRKGDFATQAIQEDASRKSQGSFGAEFVKGVGRGAVEDIYAQEYIKQGLDPARIYNQDQTNPGATSGREFGAGTVQGLIGTGTALPGMSAGGKAVDFLTKGLTNKPGVVPLIARTGLNLAGAMAGGELTKAALDPYVNPRAGLPEDLRRTVTDLRSTPTSTAGQNLSSLAFFGLGSRNTNKDLAFTSGGGLRNAIPNIVRNPSLALMNPEIAAPFGEGITRGALAGMSVLGDIRQNNSVRETLKAEGVNNPTDQQLENAGGKKPSTIFSSALFNMMLGKRTPLGDTLSMDWMSGLRGSPKTTALSTSENIPEPSGTRPVTVSGEPESPVSPAGPSLRGVFNQRAATPEQVNIDTGATSVGTMTRIPTSEMRRSWAFTGLDRTPMRLRFNTGQPGAVIENVFPMDIKDASDVTKHVYDKVPKIGSVSVLGVGTNGEIAIQKPYLGSVGIFVTNLNALKTEYPDLYTPTLKSLVDVASKDRGRDPQRLVKQIDPDAVYDYETDIAKENTDDSSFPYRLNINTESGNKTIQVRVVPYSSDSTSVETEAAVRVATESGLVFVVNRANLYLANGDQPTELKGKNAPRQENVKGRNGFELPTVDPVDPRNNGAFKLPIYKPSTATDRQAIDGMTYGASFDSAVLELEQKGVRVGSLLKIPFGNQTHNAHVIGIHPLTGQVGVPGTVVGIYVKDVTNPRLNPYYIPFRNIGAVGGISVVSAPPASTPATTPADAGVPVEAVTGVPAVEDTAAGVSVNPASTSVPPAGIEIPQFLRPSAPSGAAPEVPVNPEVPVDAEVPVDPGSITNVGSDVPEAAQNISDAQPPVGVEGGMESVDPVSELTPDEGVQDDPIAASTAGQEFGVDRVNEVFDVTDLTEEEVTSAVEYRNEIVGVNPEISLVDAQVMALSYERQYKSAFPIAENAIADGYRVTDISVKQSSKDKKIEDMDDNDIVYHEVKRVGGGGSAFRIYSNGDVAINTPKPNEPLNLSDWVLMTPESVQENFPGTSPERSLTVDEYRQFNNALGFNPEPPVIWPNIVVQETYGNFVERIVAQRQPQQEVGQTPPDTGTQTEIDNAPAPLGNESPVGQQQSVAPSTPEQQAAVQQRRQDLNTEFKLSYNAAPDVDANENPLSVNDTIDWMIGNLQERGVEFTGADVLSWLNSEMDASGDEYKSVWARAILDLKKRLNTTSSDQVDINDAGSVPNYQWPYGEQFQAKIPEEELPDYLKGRDPGYEFFGMTTGEEARRLPSGQARVQKAPASVKPKQALQVWMGEASPRVFTNAEWRINLKFKGVSNRTDLKDVLINTWKMKPEVAQDVSELVDRWIIGAAKEHLRIRGYQVNQVARARRQEGKDKIPTAEEIAAFDPSDQNDKNWLPNYREQAILDMTEDNLKILAETVTRFYTEKLGVFANLDRDLLKQTDLGVDGMYTFIRNTNNDVVPLVMSVSGGKDVEAQVHEIIHALSGMLPAPSQHFLATTVFGTEFYDQEYRKPSDEIPAAVEETFVTRFVNTMIQMSVDSKAGKNVKFNNEIRAEGGYDNTFVDLLIKIGGHLMAEINSPQGARHGTNELPYNPYFSYAPNTPVIIRANDKKMQGYLAETLTPTTNDNVRSVKVRLENGDIVNREIRGKRADFSTGDVDYYRALPDATRQAVERIVGHAYEHTANAIKQHVPEVKVSNFDFRGFAYAPKLTVGYRWYNQVEDGLAWYASRGLPRTAQDSYIPMTKNRMYKRIINSHLGWLDKGWAQYVSEVGPKILEQRQASILDPVWDDVIPVQTRPALRASLYVPPTKQGDPSTTGSFAPTVIIPSPGSTSAPNVKVDTSDVDTSWLDDIDGFRSSQDPAGITFAEINTEIITDAEAGLKHPSEEITAEEAKTQGVSVLMRLAGTTPLINIKKGEAPSISAVDRIKITYLANQIGGVLVPQRYVAYKSFKDAISASLINVANRESVTIAGADKKYIKDIGYLLSRIDPQARNLVNEVFSDLIKDLKVWKSSGKKALSNNSWDDIISYVERVRDVFQEPGNGQILSPDYFKAVTDPSVSHTNLVGVLDSLNGQLHRSIELVARFNEMISKGAGRDLDRDDKLRMEESKRYIPQYQSLIKTVEDRINQQVDNADTIRELLVQAQNAVGIGPKPLSSVFTTVEMQTESDNVVANTDEDAMELMLETGINEETEKIWEQTLAAMKASGDPERIKLADDLIESFKRSGTFQDQLTTSLPLLIKDISKLGIDDAMLPILSHPFIPFVTSRYAMLGLRRYSSFIFARLKAGTYSYDLGRYVNNKNKADLIKRRAKDVAANHANHDLADLYQDVNVAVYEELKTILSGMKLSDDGKSVFVTKVWKDDATGTKSLATKQVSVSVAAEDIRKGIQNASRRGVMTFSSQAMSGKDIYSNTYEIRAKKEIDADTRWQIVFGTSDDVITKEVAYRAAVRTLAYAMRMSKDPIEYVDVDTFINNSDLHGNIPAKLLQKIKDIDTQYKEAASISNESDRTAALTNLNTQWSNFVSSNPRLKTSPAFAVPVNGYALQGEVKFTGIQRLAAVSEGSGFTVGINIPKMPLSSIYDVKIASNGNMTRAEYHEQRYMAQEATRLQVAQISMDDPFKATDIASEQSSPYDSVAGKDSRQRTLHRLVVQNTFEKLVSTEPYKAYVHGVMPILKPEAGDNWSEQYSELSKDLAALKATKDASSTEIGQLQDVLDTMDTMVSQAATELYKHVVNGIRSFRDEAMDTGPFVGRKNGELVARPKLFNDQMYDVMLDPSAYIRSKPTAGADKFLTSLQNSFPGAYALLKTAHDNGVSFSHVLSGIHQSWKAGDAEDRAQFKDIALDVMTIYAMSEQLKSIDDKTYEMTEGTNLSPQLVDFSQTLQPDEYFQLMRIAYNRMLAPGVETLGINETEASTITSSGKATISNSVKSLATKMNAKELESFSKFTGLGTYEKISLLWRSYNVEIDNLINADKALPKEEQLGLRTPFKQLTTLEQVLELVYGSTSWDAKHPYKSLATEFVDDLNKRILGSNTLVQKFAKNVANSLLITPTGWIQDKWIPDVMQKPITQDLKTFTSNVEKAFVFANAPMYPRKWGNESTNKLKLYTNILNQYNSVTNGLNRTVFTDAEIRIIVNANVSTPGEPDVSLADRNKFFADMVEGRRLSILNPLQSYLGLVAKEATVYTMADVNNFMSDNNYSQADRIGALNQIIGHMSATRNPLRAVVIAMGRLPVKAELDSLYSDLAPHYRGIAKNQTDIKKSLEGKTEQEADVIVDAAAKKILVQEYLKLSDYVVSRNFSNFMDMVSVTEVNVLTRRSATKSPVTGITLGTSVNTVNIHEIAVNGTFLALSDVFTGNSLAKEYLSNTPIPSWIGSVGNEPASIARSQRTSVVRSLENDIKLLNSGSIAELIFNPSKRKSGETYTQAGKGLTAPGLGKPMTETSLTTRKSSVKAKFGSDAPEETIFVEQMRVAVANAFQEVLSKLDNQIVRSLPLPVKKIEGKSLVSVLTNQYQMQANDKNQKLVTALRKFAKGYVGSVLQGRREFVRALNDSSLDNNRYEKQYDKSGTWDGLVTVKDALTGEIKGEVDYRNGTVVDADGKSKLIGVNANGFNAAQVALIETFIAIDPMLDLATEAGRERLDVYRTAVKNSIHLRTVPAEYWHGRQNLEQEDGLPNFQDPLYMSSVNTNEYSVNERFGTLDPATRDQYVQPSIRKMLTPNENGVVRLKLTSDGTPAYNGEGYHVLTPDNVYSHTYAKFIAAGLAPDKALEVYSLTEHPLFQNWMHGEFVDNVHMSTYGSFNTQGRRSSPLHERSVRIVVRTQHFEMAANEYINGKSKKAFENLKFTFDEALGSGLTKEELNTKLNNMTADEHNGVQFPLTLMAHVETARQLAKPYMTDDVMSVARPTIAYQSIAKQVKTGQPFTTMAFDYEGEGSLKFNTSGWKVHDLGSGLHRNSNRSNDVRAVRFKNPLVYDAHQDGIAGTDMEEIVKRAFDQNRDGIVLLNVAEGMFDDNYRNIAITMNDANIRPASSLLLSPLGVPAAVASRDTVEGLFMTISPDSPDKKIEEWITKHAYKPVWDLNTASSVPVLRDEDPDYKHPAITWSNFKDPSKKALVLQNVKDKAIRWAMIVGAEFQQAMRNPLGVDFAFLNIHTGKANPVISMMTGRKQDAITWTTSFTQALRFTRPNTQVNFFGKRLGLIDKMGRRAFVERYMHWRTLDGGKWFEMFKDHNMLNVGLVQFEKNVEAAKAHRYRQLRYQGVNINYDDIRMDLMDFDEQGFHADLYEPGTLQGMLPIIGLAGRQIAAHSDEFVMQMTVSWIKDDPELANMTREELASSDKVFKIMKFISLMSGQFQYTTDERWDSIIGLIGKIMLQAPRWLASNLFFMYGANQGLSSVFGEMMGGRDNRSLNIYVHPGLKGLATAYKTDPTVNKQMKASVAGAIMALIAPIVMIEASRLLLDNGYKYLIRHSGKWGGARTYDWEYKPTEGYWDVVNKLVLPLAKITAQSAKRPGLDSKEDQTPEYSDTLTAFRPYGWMLSPVLTRPAGWVTGKDAISRNLYDPDASVDVVWNKVWGPRLEKLTGTKMPEYLYVPRLYTEQYWSWLQSGMEATRKADEVGESAAKAEAIGITSAILSAIGTGWQYNPEPPEYALQQHQIRMQRMRNMQGDKPLSATKPKDFIPMRFKD